MDTKKINKIMRTVKSVAKQSTKVVAAALPIGSIVVNVLDSHQAFPSQPGVAFKHFVSKYTGIDEHTGEFSLDRAMKGTGALIVAGIAGWAITQVV